MSATAARVVLLCGPSGSGKSRLARCSRLPVLHLDDFYKAAGDPTLPLRDGAVDWDSPAAWDGGAALAALRRLCAREPVEVPVYDFRSDGPVGRRVVEVGDAPALVAEGIFAAELVAACRARGLLADALCLRRHPLVTFARRLLRDVAERRKPLPVILRRSWALLRADRDVVAGQVARGARPVGMREALAVVRALSPARAVPRTPA